MSQFEPDPRRYPYSVLIDGELYVYGGKDEVTDLLQIFDSCLEVWKEVPTHGSPPPGLAAVQVPLLTLVTISMSMVESRRITR